MDKVCEHVKRLHRYLPFGPAHDQIYEENALPSDSLNLETVALRYLEQAIEDGASAVILTGDAGHGKTHLCRRVMETVLGYDEKEARDLLNKKCDGRVAIDPASGKGNRPLRVFKDISELAVTAAASQLESALQTTNETAIVCANEGRLRAVLEDPAAGLQCKQLLETFRASFATGRASADGKVHIINLNHQSIASDGSESLAERTLKGWLDGRRWSVCQDCDSRPHCPIHHNYRFLASGEDNLGDQRRERITRLLATAERLGTVITIRDLLMLVAYVVTGGLQCKDVHLRVRKNKVGWQHAYAYYNLLFQRPPNLGPDATRRLPVLHALQKLDPGMVATRSTDDRLINSQDVFPEGQLDLQYTEGRQPTVDTANGIDQVIGNPKNRAERDSEATFVSSIVRGLRRRDFFEFDAQASGVLKRLGFEWADAFHWVMSGESDPARSAELKNHLIGGLHAIQGMQFVGRRNELHLVEPAFGRATNNAVIVARHLPASRISLLSVPQSWKEDARESREAINKTVDWNHRRVVVRINMSEKHYDLGLDLMGFEFLMRLNSSAISEDFFAGEIRRLTNRLGLIAQEDTHVEEETIQMFIDGQRFGIGIDHGVISVQGG